MTPAATAFTVSELLPGAHRKQTLLDDPLGCLCAAERGEMGVTVGHLPAHDGRSDPLVLHH